MRQERWDGTGYPGGCGGNEIPLHEDLRRCGRLRLDDKQPALAEAIASAVAIAEIHVGAGEDFDPEIGRSSSRSA
jgi:response regulator RpfG family c-di-GMP phosphodiesterase